MKVDELLSSIRLPLKYKLIATIAAGVIVIVPQSVLHDTFGIILSDNLRMVISIVFFIALSLTAADLLVTAGKAAIATTSQFIKQLLVERQVVKYLKSLTSREKEYLKPFFEQDTISVPMPINDGIVSSLEKKQIIYRASIVSSSHLNWPYNIQPIVWDAVKKHPDLIGL